ncbi:DNA polymerase/3'-5' exonuclease PolX [Geotalea sp. SG265]|uniref:DNA polymerase/3'-5' exonuclease PolX n=1 Tax=Geotalea sp. SG265 TaxID=2922867 RepID=UPI001FAF1200|nr:DNA polymerase/3'-5' exonuclease PolX [Geotalea sp. SG265]
MRNHEIARIFSEIADIHEFRGYDIFRIRAYRRAALNLEGLSQPVDNLSHKELLEIPGIGKDFAAKIEEYLATGKIEAHEKLKEEVPLGMLELLVIPGLGPAKARLLYDKLGVKGIDDLERAATEHRLAGAVPKFGEKSEENILKGIEMVKRGRERFPLGRVLPLANSLVENLRKQGPVERIELAGSIRRWKETVKDIDIVATSPDPLALMAVFTSLPQVTRVLLKGPTKSSVIVTEGIQVDLRVVERESYGAALAYLTGSKNHNVRLRDMAVRQGLKINEYGIFRIEDDQRIGGAEEEDVYRVLDLPFIAPELREDSGEVEAALSGALPRLINLKDIRGDLHVHSRWSDGMHSLEKVAAAAKKRGLSYIALTDHSRSLAVTRGLTVERLMEQREEIAAFNRENPDFRVLHGTEMDILPDGSLDFPDEVLRELDFVIASIHSAFKQPQEQITARVAAAMRNPWVTMIAHPTGRVLGEREAYEIDMDEVLRLAAETGTALEINAYPLRLDLNDRHARRARELGIPMAINTDAHVVSNFEFLPYGVAIARRGWLEKGNVLNALSLPELLGRKKKNSGKLSKP